MKTRLESSSGISFTEFTYNLLQAYDFKHLHQAENCTVQLGGSDQYGNIMAGIDMIQKEASLAKKFETTAYGLTMPLLTTASGAKFGKSAGNAIWLDSALTSPVELYQVSSHLFTLVALTCKQFFLQTRDADLVRYLKTFTFLTLDEIDRISREHSVRAPALSGRLTFLSRTNRKQDSARGRWQARSSTLCTVVRCYALRHALRRACDSWLEPPGDVCVRSAFPYRSDTSCKCKGSDRCPWPCRSRKKA